MNDQFYELTKREESLVIRGYDYNDVKSLCSFNNETIKEVATKIYNELIKDCKRVDNPICIYLGGQPGSGKSVHAHRLKDGFPDHNIVIINLDTYRSYHPKYFKIEELIKKHWQNRLETNNDSMGNDIADFTHHFAGSVTDEIYKMLSDTVDNKGYNIIFDWGMRNSKEPLEIMSELHDKGYKNHIIFILVSETISKEACKLRSDVINNKKHLIRKVCDNFHDLCVSTLPDSAECIYYEGINNNTLDSFALMDRNDIVIWDSNNNNSLKDTYYEYLHNNIEFENSISDMLKTYEEESKGFQE